MLSKKLLKNITKRNFFKIVPQNMEGVRLFLGKMQTEIKAGFHLNLPLFHKIWLVDMRERIMQIPEMRIVSLDNVTYSVEGSIQFKIIDSKKALLNVQNVSGSIVEKSKMELRSLLGSMEINEVLKSRSTISDETIKRLGKIEEDWGVSIVSTEITDIKFDDSMTKAMAVKAESDRMAEAKIINARADVETAKQYSEASKIYGENPITMRLREFQLWSSVSKNQAATIYVVPSNLLDFIKPLTQSKDIADKDKK